MPSLDDVIRATPKNIAREKEGLKEVAGDEYEIVEDLVDAALTTLLNTRPPRNDPRITDIDEQLERIDRVIATYEQTGYAAVAMVQEFSKAYEIGGLKAVGNLEDTFTHNADLLNSDNQRGYTFKILKELQNGAPIPILNRYAHEIRFNARAQNPNTHKDASIYLDRMVKAYRNSPTPETYEEIDKLADKIHEEVRGEQLEELHKKPGWKKFYQAFVNATRALASDMKDVEVIEGTNASISYQQDSFRRHLSNSLGYENGNPLQYVREKFGTSNIARFVDENSLPRTQTPLSCNERTSKDMTPIEVTAAFQ